MEGCQSLSYKLVSEELESNQLVMVFTRPYPRALGNWVPTALHSRIKWNKTCASKDFKTRYYWGRFCAFRILYNYTYSFSLWTKNFLFSTLVSAKCHPNFLRICIHNYSSVENKASCSIIVPNEPKILNFYFHVWLSSLHPLMQHIW